MGGARLLEVSQCLAHLVRVRVRVTVTVTVRVRVRVRGLEWLGLEG